jgi:bifunctional non-homologous end joining protein LigD
MADVKLSHPEKVLFPDDGITKADLAAYYEAVAPAMVPHTKERPLNLWRWNAGIERDVVVQQAIPKGAPEWVSTVVVPRRRGGDVVHAMANDADTLRWLAQVNCITPHVWTSRADRLDRPDRIIFDLDPPDEGVEFDLIREGALALGEHLRSIGLEPYAMTSGSRGIHVLAPLRRTKGHDEVRQRAAEIGEAVAAEQETLTTEWRKNKREGRILIDTARNTYAQTTVAPYAVRAKPGAPVATPLRWEELEDPELRADSHTLASVPARLESFGDPWKGLGRA